MLVTEEEAEVLALGGREGGRKIEGREGKRRKRGREGGHDLCEAIL